MTYVFGLGNPGDEYSKNRHNVGRMAADFFSKKYEGKKLKVLTPDTFMNHSGKFVAKFVKSKKQAQNTVIIQDDIDLPLGSLKISYDRGSGGHNGIESIIKSLKTREFIRIRIGVSPKKKPSGEEAVLKFLLGDFRKPELDVLKKTFKTVSEALETIAEEGKDKAMNLYN